VSENTEYLIIGRIARPFGIQGEVKIIPITDHAERFVGIDAVFVKQNGSFRKLEVAGSRIVKNAVLLKFVHVSDRSDAERYRDCMLYIDREHAAPIEDDSNYYYDLLGCTVKTTDGTEIGIVTDIQNAGSCDVYSVKPENSSEPELLIPVVRDIVKKIDIKKKEICIEIIDGLL
jgi:16S rRNA processing protein RimM